MVPPTGVYLAGDELCLVGDVRMARMKSIRTLGRMMKFGRQRRHSSDLPTTQQFVDTTDNMGTVQSSFNNILLTDMYFISHQCSAL